MVKDNELKPIRRSEEVAARTSTDPKNVKANIISKRRRKKINWTRFKSLRRSFKKF